MAGRKSKTATAAKPKPKAKTGAKTGSRSGVKSSSAKKAAKGKSPSRKAQSTKKVAATKSVAKKATSKKQGKAVEQLLTAAKKVKSTTKGKAKHAPSATSANAKIVSVYAELESLAAYIDAAKQEIAAIRPENVKEELLPSATDELDAIVEATADATNVIMDNCERVEGVMGGVSAEVSDTLMEATTRIYEACTFQDITGQRIGKVVTALKSIEERIDALLYTLGDGKAPKPKAKPKPKTKQEIADADLLEGPQLGDKAKSQAEIDDLLASFD